MALDQRFDEVEDPVVADLLATDDEQRVVLAVRERVERAGSLAGWMGDERVGEPVAGREAVVRVADDSVGIGIRTIELGRTGGLVVGRVRVGRKRLMDLRVARAALLVLQCLRRLEGVARLDDA